MASPTTTQNAAEPSPMRDAFSIKTASIREVVHDRDKINKHDAEKQKQQACILRGNAAAKLAADLGPRYARDRITLDKFQIYDQRQRAVLERVGQIAAKIDDVVRAGRNILILGAVGTGKDHLLAHLL